MFIILSYFCGNMIIVSKCLAGFPCRYNAAGCADESIVQMLRRGEAVAVCPEQLGGLPTPRPPAEIVGGDGFDVLDGSARVLDSSGRDVTAAFIAGANAALYIARRCGAERAILKAKSPSCGAGVIYDGSFSASMRKGYGVCSALFERSGLTIDSI